LTLPEVFHDNIADYCLAKAHDKNQNYKASGEAKKDFEKEVSTRRYETENSDEATYKMADPEDYEWSGYN
jgi:hypothetical protein